MRYVIILSYLIVGVCLYEKELNAEIESEEEEEARFQAQDEDEKRQGCA